MDYETFCEIPKTVSSFTDEKGSGFIAECDVSTELPALYISRECYAILVSYCEKFLEEYIWDSFQIKNGLITFKVYTVV